MCSNRLQQLLAEYDKAAYFERISKAEVLIKEMVINIINLEQQINQMKEVKNA